LDEPLGDADSSQAYSVSQARSGDLETARKAFLDVISNRKSPQAAVVAAARGLADLEHRQGPTRRPTTVAAVQAMSQDELVELIGSLEQRGFHL
jgi:hypothetical protein